MPLIKREIEEEVSVEQLDYDMQKWLDERAVEGCYYFDESGQKISEVCEGDICVVRKGYASNVPLLNESHIVVHQLIPEISCALVGGYDTEGRKQIFVFKDAALERVDHIVPVPKKRNLKR